MPADKATKAGRRAKATLTENEAFSSTPANDYRPDQEERDILKKTWTAYTELKQLRDQRFRFFNDRTLKEMVDDAQMRFNLYLRPRQDPEEWQTQYVSGTIRNKVVAILARLASRRMKRFFYGEDNDDKWRARICKVLDERVAITNQAHKLQFFKMLAAVVKGTVVMYHGYHSPQVSYYDVDGLDMTEPSNPKTNYKIKTKAQYQNVYSEIVPLEDFFPGDLRKQRPTDMWRCGRQRLMNFESFQEMFGHYPNAKHVRAGGEAKEDPFFKEFLPSGMGKDQVWVFELYKKPSATPDQMVIMANGVLLTPKISPLPFNHKINGLGNPFTAAQFESYDEHFFYGMPLPFKLKGDSDVSDAVWRMAIDLLYLMLNPPILSADAEEIEDKELSPGVVYKVSDPNNTKWMEMKGPGEALGWLRALANNQNLASVDNVQQGTAGSKSATATEIEAATEAAMQLFSLFQQFMEWEAEDEGNMQIQNILQFYAMPIGRDEKTGKPEYRTIRVDNVPKITDGKMGSVKLHFVASKADLPPTQPLTPEQRAKLSEVYGEKFDEIVVRVNQTNPDVEDVWITAEFMKDFAVGCHVVPNSSVKQSDALNKAQFLEWSRFLIEVAPERIDKDKLLKQAGEIFDRNIDEILVDKNQEQAATPQGVPPEIAEIYGMTPPVGPRGADDSLLSGINRSRTASPAARVVRGR